MKFSKKKEVNVVVLAVLITLSLTLIMGTIVVSAQKSIEGKSENVEETNDFPGDYQSLLYKEATIYPEIAKQVCEKYNLDYETVTRGEITGEILDFEIALQLIQMEGDLPLHKPSGSDNIGSLEVNMNDIHAFNGSRVLIDQVCQEAGIVPETSKIKDLTIEQIIEILELCYETSDHPKN